MGELVPVLGVLTGIIIPLGVFVWLYLSDKNKNETILEMAKQIDDPEEIKSVLSNWQEPHGDRRQEIVLIGYADKMDESFLKECFDACLLNDEEMNLGEISWSDLKDPLPQFE